MGYGRTRGPQRLRALLVAANRAMNDDPDKGKGEEPTMMDLMVAQRKARDEGRVNDAAKLRDQIMARLEKAQKLPSRRIDQ
jgi:hypothetical protein